ncbi:DUF7218 family protein [Mycetocola zhadangensis]|uniref:Rho termination factor n=1 Tax=Mycetocola zhadangensis TaxID=1164595 RepID=A0A3L7J9L3_9MICO|nr:Rho termination factor [Mycetocola zhadangensis]RLQ86151.1 Rho termination factor [Mycetocola zhadangensis]GGE88821.1 hypothetical protein GCM10011313_09370 [Mycetocola zhadangensis]
MPQNAASRLKDPGLYDKLRDDGQSKQKAARIANAAGTQGRSKLGQKGGEFGSYEDWMVDDLRKRAKEIGQAGYSRKKKSDLISALRNS